MRLYDGGKIIFGLLVFLGLMTMPVWYNAATGKGAYVPEPEMPAKEKSCVESKEYMKAFHMDLLNRWRDTVVREGKRVHVSPDGKEYDMSLSRTCLKCHSNREEFCTKCHGYAGVDPYCWECHVDDKAVKR